MENRYGIEIELENCRRMDRYGQPSMWTVEGDGSLRNAGMEFKSNRDYSLSDAKISLSYLHDFLVGSEIEAEANPRCGVHVHMDVRDMSHVQIYNLMCNYSMIEPTFFAYVNTFGDDREGSHFCVPYYHTKERVASLMHAFKDYNLDTIQYLGRKYMALNMLPYLSFGSVEWRQFPTVLPVTQIIPWLDILDTFKERSKLGVFTEDEVQPWLDEVFPHLSTEDRIDTGLETYYYHTLPEREETSHVMGRFNTRTVGPDVDSLRDMLDQAVVQTRAFEPDDEDMIPFGDDEEEEDDEEDAVPILPAVLRSIPRELRLFAINHRWLETMDHELFRPLDAMQRMQLLQMVELERAGLPL